MYCIKKLCIGSENETGVNYTSVDITSYKFVEKKCKICKGQSLLLFIIIIIIIIIIEFLTSQFWLGNIHLSWDVVINRIRLGSLICSFKSFLQLNMCQELQISAFVYMYWGAS